MCDQVLSEDIPIDLHDGHGNIWITKPRLQRKDAKSAKFLIVFIKDFLCVLCVFALKNSLVDDTNE